jgi:hypothetical protein
MDGKILQSVIGMISMPISKKIKVLTPKLAYSQKLNKVIRSEAELVRESPRFPKINPAMTTATAPDTLLIK